MRFYFNLHHSHRLDLNFLGMRESSRNMSCREKYCRKTFRNVESCNGKNGDIFVKSLLEKPFT
jgi:hypothetical protein